MRKRSRQVIILDDEGAVRRSLTVLLEEFGYQTRSHGDPVELLAAGEPAEPACLLLDYDLNHPTTGLDVLREIVNRGWRIAVIVITGRWSPEQAAATVRKGAIACLAKPYHPSALLEEIEAGLAYSCSLHQKSGTPCGAC